MTLAVVATGSAVPTEPVETETRSVLPALLGLEQLLQHQGRLKHLPRVGAAARTPPWQQLRPRLRPPGSSVLARAGTALAETGALRPADCRSQKDAETLGTCRRYRTSTSAALHFKAMAAGVLVRRCGAGRLSNVRAPRRPRASWHWFHYWATTHSGLYHPLAASGVPRASRH